MAWYRYAGTRMEHFKGVDDPLVVRAQQRTNILARRIAEPLGYTSPAPFLTDHLKSPFIRHNLEQKKADLENPIYREKISSLKI